MNQSKLLNFIFPHLCFHCKESLPQDRLRLCAHCFDELHLVNPIGRCPFCFEEVDSCSNSSCGCKKQSDLPFYFATCFEPLTVPKWFSNELRKGSDDMFKAISAFLLLQLQELCWDKIDIVLPYSGVSTSSARAIACCVGKSLNTQVYSPFFFYDERFPLFKFAARKNIQDRSILVLCPFTSSRSELIPLVENLMSLYPRQIRALGIHHT